MLELLSTTQEGACRSEGHRRLACVSKIAFGRLRPTKSGKVWPARARRGGANKHEDESCCRDCPLPPMAKLIALFPSRLSHKGRRRFRPRRREFGPNLAAAAHCPLSRLFSPPACLPWRRRLARAACPTTGQGHPGQAAVGPFRMLLSGFCIRCRRPLPTPFPPQLARPTLRPFAGKRGARCSVESLHSRPRRWM